MVRQKKSNARIVKTSLTPELIEKAKAVESVADLLELAKANNVELTETEAKTYFEQINTNVIVSDDELDAVAGGFGNDSYCNNLGIVTEGKSIEIANRNNCSKYG